MRKIFILSTLALAVLSACNSSSDSGGQRTNQTFNLDTTNLKSGDTFYQCEMHEEVISDKAGNCPKCQMDLIEMKKN